jgi:replicative DNA helicase
MDTDPHDLHLLAERQAKDKRLALAEENHSASLALQDGGGALAQYNAEALPYSAMQRVNAWNLGQLRDEKASGVDAVATPWPSINRMCMMAGGRQGIAHGWHVIVAGASNRGKTTLANNLAVHAMKQGENVSYFALESDLEELGARMCALASGTSMRTITRGRDYDIEADRDAARILTNLPGALYVNREPLYQVCDMVEVIEAFHRQHGTRMFIVDHLQLAQAGTEAAIYAKITEVSNALNTVAKRHKLISIGLSQLTTGAARNHDACPTAYDLLGGGPLINDANLIFVIDHCAQHWRVDRDARHTDTMLALGKNRHGPTGELPIRLHWDTSAATELAVGAETWAEAYD